MKPIHFFITTLVAMALFFTPGISGAWGDPPKKVAFIVVLDDSGAYDKRMAKRADRNKLKFLQQFADLKKRKKTRNAVIDIISSSTGSTELVTQPKSMGLNWKQIEAVMKGKPERCNNLARTFTTLDSSIRQYEDEQYDEIYVYIFSSLIDVPAPCDQVTNLVLPQKPPLIDVNNDGKTDLGAILTRSPKVKTIIFYGVKAEQYCPWIDVLKPKDWIKRDASNVFRMKKFNQTELALEEGLHIRRD